MFDFKMGRSAGSPVKIEIALIIAPPDCALPLEGDAAHIAIDAVVAQAESGRQFFAAQQFAVFHIGALQNVDPVMPAVGFKFCRFEARFFIEHGIHHPRENLEEKRPDKGEANSD